MRARWCTVHRWLGLVCGPLFVLQGLTGSALVFYREIDAWLNPRVFVAAQPLPAHSPSEILAAIQKAHPDRSRAWRLEVPSGANQAWTARYYFAEETRHRKFAPLQVTVDPYTLEVRESRLWGTYAMTFLYDLHYILLLDGIGSTLVALAGILLLASLVSGVRIWWPSRAGARTALTLKRRASAERRVYDLHKLGGIYGLVLMAVLALTGSMLARPEWFRPLLESLSPVYQMPSPKAVDIAAPWRVDADEAVRIARREFPDAAIRWIETPDTGEGVFRLRLQQPGEPSRRFPQTYVWIDATSGQVLARRDAREQSVSDTVLAWLHPLHNGEAFGLTGRWLVFIAGWIPLLLLVTGWMRWRSKVRAAVSRLDRDVAAAAGVFK
jgi:uncharacterized iron-regulated membrane protein